MNPAVSYLVCGAPRCGSGLLCEALRATGVAGNPREYFVPAFPGSDALETGMAGFEESPWARERGATNFPAFLAAVLAEGRSANGVFAASLPWSSFSPMMEKIRVFTPYGGNATFRQLLRRSFGLVRFIHLVRRDRVRQAVSWAITQQTALDDEPSFDPELLDSLLLQIEEAEAGWESLFDVLSLEPLQLAYEDWTEDLPATLHEILHWLGLPAGHGAFDANDLVVEREKTSLLEAWATRYRALKGL